jgi:cytochrome c553
MPSLVRFKAALFVILMMTVLPSWGQSASNESQVRGERLAQSLCIACHGPRGLSVNPLWPNLAGQQKAYIVKALNDYRSGLRNDPLMNAQSQTLTNAQIEDVAEYYSSFKVQIVEPVGQGSANEN